MKKRIAGQLVSLRERLTLPQKERRKKKIEKRRKDENRE